MITVDTFFDDRDIYLSNDGMYYIARNGVIVSPAFATLKAAQDNAWKYEVQDEH